MKQPLYIYLRFIAQVTKHKKSYLRQAETMSMDSIYIVIR